MSANYEAFSKRMEESYPKMFPKPYGGFAVDEGWWPIIEALCSNIQRYTDWQNTIRETRLNEAQQSLVIPDAVPQVVVEQVKEKFGGLRFYYQGGDKRIQGMVQMAESWAESVCEECGKPGKLRSGGWLKTLCDEHAKKD